MIDCRCSSYIFDYVNNFPKSAVHIYSQNCNAQHRDLKLEKQQKVWEVVLVLQVRFTLFEYAYSVLFLVAGRRM